MIRLAELSIRRPKAALVCWGVFAAVFIAIGLGVTDRLSPTMTFVPGTESTRAEDLAEAEFGPSTLVPVLLTGPQRQLDRQGPIVVHELRYILERKAHRVHVLDDPVMEVLRDSFAFVDNR